jgi:hypothetical protein
MERQEHNEFNQTPPLTPSLFDMNFSSFDNEQSNVIKEILRVDYKQYDSEQGKN